MNKLLWNKESNDKTQEWIEFFEKGKLYRNIECSSVLSQTPFMFIEFLEKDEELYFKVLLGGKVIDCIVWKYASPSWLFERLTIENSI